MTSEERSLLDLFINLVKINSPSFKEDRIVNFITNFLKSIDIEFIVQELSHNDKKIYNIIANAGKSQTKKVFLSAHMDTVAPTEGINIIEEKDRIRTDGTTILGADDKSAIAIMLQLAKTFKNNADYQLIFTSAEEVGLIGAKYITKDLIKSSFGIVLDHDGEAGIIVNGAPNYMSLIFEVYGKSSHAGLSPEKGRNAIKMAAQIVQRFPSGKIDFETTANVGVISGGKAPNIVPDFCEIKTEIRSHNIEKIYDIIKDMRNFIALEKKDFKINIKENLEYEGFYIEPEDKNISKLTEIMKKYNITPKFVKSMGGSDANIFNKYTKTINISAGMMNPHEEIEYLDLNIFFKTYYIMKEFLQNI